MENLRNVKFATKQVTIDTIIESIDQQQFEFVNEFNGSKIYTNKATGSSLIVAPTPEGGCFYDCATNLNGNVFTFLNKYISGYSQQKVELLDPKIDESHNVDTQNKVMPGVSAADDYSVDNQNKATPEASAVYDDSFDKQNGTIKDNKVTSYHEEFLHDTLKIPKETIKKTRFSMGVGVYNDYQEKSRDLIFKLDNNKGRLLIRESVNKDQGKKTSQMLTEGDFESPWVFNKTFAGKGKSNLLIVCEGPISAMSLYSMHQDTLKDSTFAAIPRKALTQKGAGEVKRLNEEVNGDQVRENVKNIRILANNNKEGELFAIAAKCHIGGLRYINNNRGLNFFKKKECISPIMVKENAKNNTLTITCAMPNLKPEDEKYIRQTFLKGLFGADISESVNNKGFKELSITIDTRATNLQQLNANLTTLTGIESFTSKEKTWNKDMQASFEQKEQKENQQVNTAQASFNI